MRNKTSIACLLLLILKKLVYSMKKPIVLSASQKSVLQSYKAPIWCSESLPKQPKYRFPLSNLPTPIQSVSYSKLTPGCKLFMKRDDYSGGMETGGNKIRKLEFLLPEVLSLDCDAVVTIGGEQSNHVRATAAACRMVFGKDVEIHTILRMDSRRNASEEIGTTGNLLLDRFFGCNIYTCTPGEYGRVGSNFLVEEVCNHLRSKGKNPYPIPVGGSNAIGTWGYIHAVDELLIQLKSLPEPVHHIAFASGSGGTAAGITIGIALATAYFQDIPLPKIHAIGVCDNPDYFYNTMATIAMDMGFLLPSNKTTNLETIKDFFKSHVTVHQGKGLGYAKSTSNELSFFMNFAMESGIVLDPVYTGKALYNLCTYMEENPVEFEHNGNVLFWHTGNALGMFSKVDELMKSVVDNDDGFVNLQTISPVKRLDIYGKGPIVPAS